MPYARPITISSESLGVVAPSGFQDDGAYEPNEVFMKLALEEARRAVAVGQHPVGALITTTETTTEIVTRESVDLEFGLVLRGNQTDYRTLGHGETLSLDDGERIAGGRDNLGSVRSVLYTTHEPCPMCAGAIVNSKLAGVVCGTSVQDAQRLASEGVRWRNNAVSGLDIIRGQQQANRPQKFIIERFMRDECLEVLELARSLGD